MTSGSSMASSCSKLYPATPFSLPCSPATQSGSCPFGKVLESRSETSRPEVAGTSTKPRSVVTRQPRTSAAPAVLARARTHPPPHQAAGRPYNGTKARRPALRRSGRRTEPHSAPRQQEHQPPPPTWQAGRPVRVSAAGPTDEVIALATTAVGHGWCHPPHGPLTSPPVTSSAALPSSRPVAGEWDGGPTSWTPCR